MNTRKNFVEALAIENSKAKTLTENGAVAYASSGKELVDFNFKLSQYRNMPETDIQKDYGKVFFENPLIAVKFAFYVGDIRGGLGERKVFRACLDWLATNKPEIACAVLTLVPEYTRWDNVVKLIANNNVKEQALDLIATQLKMDMSNIYFEKPISLLAKWMPSENTSSRETRALAYKVRTGLKMNSKDYRKTLSALRKYLDVVEVKASSNRWNEINYEAVPSQANIKYNDAFFKHDENRRKEYLRALQKGETKINASVAQPHEIVGKYSNWYTAKNYDEALEQLWKALPSIMLANTLVVRDGSGSMTCSIKPGSNTSCLHVSTALAIYCSEHNDNMWRNKFITFSRNPKFIDLSNCKSLHDKLVRTYDEDDCSNTDIAKTMRLILNTAISNNCTQEEMPRNILIISDMQFDGRYSGAFNWNSTLFEDIAEEYRDAGYELPKIIFWNVHSRSANNPTLPMQDNERGLILCSGFSINNMKMFMSDEINPYKILLEQINDKRYDAVEQAVKNII